MFKLITNDGSVIGVTESINYYKKNRNNIFVRCNNSNATAIKHDGRFYNLKKHDTVYNKDSVSVIEFDAGKNLELIVDDVVTLGQQLAETDEAAIELYEANLILEEHNAEQDEAIIEIYELMEGLN